MNKTTAASQKLVYNVIDLRAEKSGKIDIGITIAQADDIIIKASIPKTVKGLFTAMRKERGDRIESKYRQALYYHEICKHGSFWNTLGYATEQELMTAFDLPMGPTLAHRAFMYGWFTINTIMVVGESTLKDIYLSAVAYNTNKHTRKTDYAAVKADIRAIFNRYKDAKHEIFIKSDLIKIYHDYEVERGGKTKRHTVTQHPDKARTYIRKTATMNRETGDPEPGILVSPPCAQCAAKEAIIAEQTKQIAKLTKELVKAGIKVVTKSPTTTKASVRRPARAAALRVEKKVSSASSSSRH